MKVNTEKWKYFLVKDLFEIHPTNAYGMKNSELMDDGSNPIVVNSSYNNGIGGYTSQDITEKGNIITFSDTTTYDAIFYQPYDFVGYSHIQGMYPKGKYQSYWTEKRFLFFLAIFKKTSSLYGFNYANKFTREIAKSIKVLLPVNEKDEPDWEYMDLYISTLLLKTTKNIENLEQSSNKKHKIDIPNWKKFHLYDDNLFEIDMGNKLDRIKMTQINPEINFVGRANTNNGITAKVDLISNMEPYPEGYMTLSLGGEYLGSCFVQPSKFYTSQNVIVLKPRWPMSLEIKQFIATMIFKESRTYYKAFVDELNKHIKKDFSFYLPIDDNQNPNWQYMENFMKKTIKKAEIDFNIIQKDL